MDKIVAVAGDVEVYESEYVGLKRGGWLTDAIVAFHAEKVKSGKVENAVLQPSQVALLCAVPELAESFGVKSCRWVLVPVNNAVLNVSRTGIGGSHWSLAVVSVEGKRAWHLDSCGRTNENVARVVVERIFGEYEFGRVTGCPQQRNNSDCGVFVCAFMETVLAALERGDADPAQSVVGMSDAFFRGYRRKIVDEIEAQM